MIKRVIATVIALGLVIAFVPVNAQVQTTQPTKKVYVAKKKPGKVRVLGTTRVQPTAAAQAPKPPTKKHPMKKPHKKVVGKGKKHAAPKPAVRKKSK